MNEIFQEKRIPFLIFVGLVISLLIVLYFLILKPKVEHLEGVEVQSALLESDIDQLERQVKIIEASGEDDTEIKSDFKLRKKIPMDSSMDTLLLSLEEMEAISTSRIENISFVYGLLGQELLEGEATEPIAPEPEPDPEVTEENTAVDNNEPEQPDERVQREISLAETSKLMADLNTFGNGTLQSITMSMDVISPDFTSFEQFINELENSERIIIVQSMEFQKPTEEELLFGDNTDLSVKYSVQLVTFYYDEKLKVVEEVVPDATVDEPVDEN